jgi:hypothetical protein
MDALTVIMSPVVIGTVIRKRAGRLASVDMPRFRRLVDESRSFLFAQAK